MAKTKRSPKPLLASAVFCDRVLEGEDGAVSAICLRDQIKIVVPPNADPETRIPISIWALIAFKSGDAVGERILRLVLRMPTGKRKLLREQVMTFNGEEAGFNLRLSVDLRIKTQGLYWLDVIVDRARFTSMPLRIIFLQQEKPESRTV